MSTELNTFLRWAEENRVTAYELQKEIGMSQSGLLSILRGDSIPRKSTIKKLVNYMNREQEIVSERSLSSTVTKIKSPVEDYLELVDIIEDMESQGRINSVDASKLKGSFLKLASNFMV